MIFTISVNL